ncbi:aminotransferase class V-fold PLP-dependent enzyme, partial [bacterium]|nr:aminotransferase class V-fold PLP-dependent enzyme [bacterium]
MNQNRFPYDPETLPRELERHYICASQEEIQAMLEEVDCSKLEDLYAHIPQEVLMEDPPEIPRELAYVEIADHLEEIANKNRVGISFLGDGLADYNTHPLLPFLCNIRGLTTAYTPYQPERSQGTLNSLWIYQSCLSMLTGFEAINASMYDRSTCLYEAIQCSVRLQRGSKTALVSETIYPGDLEVLRTMAQDTGLKIEVFPANQELGIIDLQYLEQRIEELQGDLACIVFPQVNNFGNLEEVHFLTNIAKDHSVRSIAIIDPLLLGPGGLLAPREFGDCGVDMIVGEGQHLALGPNYGGPGLGILGIRFNDSCRNDLRSSAGRYVGLAKDEAGADCKVLVMSTREQHIRKEKATSNICSNQSFVATLAGAILLARGDRELGTALQAGRTMALKAASALTQISGVHLAFGMTPFFNEVTLKLDLPIDPLIKLAASEGIELGVNVSSRRREGKSNLLLLSFSDRHSADDLSRLIAFFESQFGKRGNETDNIPLVPLEYLREEPPGIPHLPTAKIEQHYRELGRQNISPDEGPYPLGSCTMKYNPYINDYCASLKGFTSIHPQADESNTQGCLEILYETQEIFKSLLGLPAVTTQPVAGAQGELVGVKMFQAYHRDNSEGARDILLIPRSAHGTNYATATVSGFSPTKENRDAGLKLVEADSSGLIDLDQLKELIAKYDNRIAGIMVTNPNTSGIMESKFQEVAELIHSVGGLVYMDGANLNAISGWVHLGKLGVDAVHSNLHKTFSIPHGGGGPGDAIVAVSKKLIDYLPGVQVRKNGDSFETFKPSKSMGPIHRHHGNFAHKVRCYTYLRALGPEGVRRMSAIAVLSARYMFSKLSKIYPCLPAESKEPRMHEFILTLLA